MWGPLASILLPFYSQKSHCSSHLSLGYFSAESISTSNLVIYCQRSLVCVCVCVCEREREMSNMVALSSNVNDQYKEERSMDRKEEALLVEASHADNNDIQESSSELEELPKIRLMRAFVETQDPSSKEVDDPTIRRFLCARDFDISQASAMFLKYLKWRRTFVPNGFISASEVPNQIAQNKMFLQGSDKKGRPIAVVLGNRHFQDDLKEFKHFVVYGLDKTCARIPPGQEKFIAIGDLEGWGYSNSDIRGYLGALSILQDYYPERLGKMFIVHAPLVFMTVWKIVYPFIDNKTKKKIVFVENKMLKSTLLEEIDESQLPEIYGGQLPLVPI